MEDVDTNFRVAYSYCDKCSMETYTEEQKAENITIVARIRENSPVRDLEQEAIDYMETCVADGMLIPDGYEGNAREFERHFRERGRTRIDVVERADGLVIACADSMDRIGLTLDAKQEEDLLVTLCQRKSNRFVAAK